MSTQTDSETEALQRKMRRIRYIAAALEVRLYRAKDITVIREALAELFAEIRKPAGRVTREDKSWLSKSK